MNEIIETENINIEDKIYEIRGVQVMLASDVAKLYQVETKRINEVIKRNINRFPESFCFKLTKDEYDNLRSQFATSSFNFNNNYGGIRYLPYAFTEQGVAMLATILHSDIASLVSVKIMRTFVKLRKYVSNNLVSNYIINH